MLTHWSHFGHLYFGAQGNLEGGLSGGYVQSPNATTGDSDAISSGQAALAPCWTAGLVGTTGSKPGTTPAAVASRHSDRAGRTARPTECATHGGNLLQNCGACRKFVAEMDQYAASCMQRPGCSAPGEGPALTQNAFGLRPTNLEHARVVMSPSWVVGTNGELIALNTSQAMAAFSQGNTFPTQANIGIADGTTLAPWEREDYQAPGQIENAAIKGKVDLEDLVYHSHFRRMSARKRMEERQNMRR